MTVGLTPYLPFLRGDQGSQLSAAHFQLLKPFISCICLVIIFKWQEDKANTSYSVVVTNPVYNIKITTV